MSERNRRGSRRTRGRTGAETGMVAVGALKSPGREGVTSERAMPSPCSTPAFRTRGGHVRKRKSWVGFQFDHIETLSRPVLVIAGRKQY